MIRSSGIDRENKFPPIGLRSYILSIITALLVGGAVVLLPVPMLVIVGGAGVLILLAFVHPLVPLLTCLILSPLRVLIATEASFQLPIDIGQLALLVYIGAIVVAHTVRPRKSIFKLVDVWTPFSAPLIAFIFITGVSAFAATSISAWFLEWLKWIQIFVLMTIVVKTCTTVSWEWLVFGLAVAGLANAFVGIYEFFGGSGALHLLIGTRFFRAFGTFGQPNPFGGFMGLLLPLSVMASVGYALRWYRDIRNTSQHSLLIALFYAATAIILLVAMLMSWSRGAWLGLVAAFLVVGFSLPPKLKQGVLVFGLIAILGLLAWVGGLVPQSVVTRLQTSTAEFFAFEDVRGIDITPENFAVAERLAHWQAASNMIAANPWLGVGFGNYAASYPQYSLINWLEPLGHAHNYYLNIFAEVGVIGLLVYGKVWVTIFYRTWKARFHPDALTRCVVIGLLGTWTYLAIHSIFDNLYVNNLFLHLSIMLSIVALISRDIYYNRRISL